jgi:xylulokinase
MGLYLGFDSSTQSLTATVIEIRGNARRILFEHALDFDAAFPEYGTVRGVVSPQPGTVTAPPAMWAAALDRMMGVIAAQGLDVTRIRAISGAGQQHGSVYLLAGAERTLAHLDHHRPLAEQIQPLLARPVSPVWLDCSTTAECRALTSAVGGDMALAALTGSRAYERFTAAQIRKFAGAEPIAYANTDRIHLVSSFMASLLIGSHAPIEPGDGAGMNLMDLARHEWAPSTLDATAPELERRLPPIRESWTVAGELSPYWQRRYGFGPAQVVAWTGDNPSALIGLGLIEAGDLAISLGTSDTVFGAMPRAAHDPSGSGHVFGSPAGGYMALTCFANGSLARERVRDEYGLDWEGFSARLRDTPTGNGGAMMLPWFVAEITPFVPNPGVHRRRLDPSDAPRNVRAIVEAQAMAMRLHSRWIAPEVTTLRATGGAASNREILQVMADVFAADVVRIAPSNAASLGAAIRAYHADRLAEGEQITWREAIAGFTDADASSRLTPSPAAVETYTTLLREYEAFESSVSG